MICNCRFVLVWHNIFLELFSMVVDPVRLGNRTIGVNLAIFTVFRGTVSIDAAPTGKPKGLGQTRFYTDTEEIPKQINPTGLKRFLKSSRFPRSIRFGWNARRIWACTPQNRTYRTWGENEPITLDQRTEISQ